MDHKKTNMQMNLFRLLNSGLSLDKITKTIVKVRLSYEGRSCFVEVPGINVNLIENKKQMLAFLTGSISEDSPINHFQGVGDIAELIGNLVFQLPYNHSE